MRNIARRDHSDRTVGSLDAQLPVVAQSDRDPDQFALTRKFGTHPRPQGDTALAVVLQQPLVHPACGTPVLDAAAELTQYRTCQLVAVRVGPAENRQGCCIGIGQLVLGKSGIEPDPEHDGLVWRGDLSENSAQLAPIDQHIIRPLEPGLDSTDLCDGIHNRHSGQERHQPPPVRRHLAHSDTHRHGQLRVGGGAPGTAVASTPCGLMLGEQHDAIDVLPRRGARHQIGIGGSGLLNDVDASPVAAGAVGESQSVRSHGPSLRLVSATRRQHAPPGSPRPRAPTHHGRAWCPPQARIAQSYQK
ncbi:Uncharacterised protein [Mycobacteroides abscessus subsp. massiliense]|nr:Uncharacterised protein [Mycobacteroides abscessus subsp. massiliense]